MTQASGVTERRRLGVRAPREAVLPLPRPAPRALTSLTGLRILAALAVFATHADGAFGAGWWQPLHRLGANGRVGVSFFFVLSGFVLTWSGSTAGGTGRFLWNRVARIYPAYVAALIFSACVATYAGHEPAPGNWLWALSLVQAWSPHPATYYSVDGVCWSLSCEAFFYLTLPLVLPLLIRLNWRARRDLALVAVVAVLALGTVALDAGTTSATFWFVYIFPPVRWLEFLLGVIIALQLREGRLPRVSRGAAVLVLVVGYAIATMINPADVHGVATASIAATLPGFVLIVAAWARADVEGRRSRFLGSSFAQIWGQRSYSFYLLHQPMLLLVFVGVSGSASRQRPHEVAIALLAALAAAALLHDRLERPAERALRRIGPARRVPLAAMPARPQ